jgi:sarcosine oxidase
MTEIFDAIVLGLGAVGSAAVYQLRKRGATVLGIDRFKPPHEFGSTHGESRITRIACGEGLEYSAFAARSHEIWRELEHLTGTRLLTQNGLVVISGEGPRALQHDKQNFFEITVEAAKAAGIRYEVLPGAEARRRYPVFKFDARDRVYHDDTSGFVRPEACIEAQLQLAERAGAVLRYHDPVLDFDDGEVITLRTQAARYQARSIVLALGAWLPSFLPQTFASRLQVMRQVMYWFPIRADYADREAYTAERMPVFIWQLPAPQSVYGFPAIDGVASGLKIGTEQYLRSTDPQAVDRTVSADETHEMFETYVAPYFEGVSGNALKAKVCLYTVAPDSRFVIDRLGDSGNVVFASACSGHGFKHSAAVGELLAKMALGDKHQDISYFRLS